MIFKSFSYAIISNPINLKKRQKNTQLNDEHKIRILAKPPLLHPLRKTTWFVNCWAYFKPIWFTSTS